MSDEKGPTRKNITDLVQIGGPGFTENQRKRAEQDRDKFSEQNLLIIQELNANGVQVDAGLEAITQFRKFLEDIGLITADQRLGAEVSWEATFNQMLRYNRQALQAAKAQALFQPPNGGKLIVPPGNGN